MIRRLIHWVQSLFSRPDREIWRPVVGHEGFYEVSDWGRVRSLYLGVGAFTRRREEPLLLSRLVRGDGYYKVALSRPIRVGRYLQGLVLEAFHGPCPPGCRATHLDGNRENNALSNLGWKTPAEISALQLARDSVPRGDRHGLALHPECRARGERHGQAKLTADDIRVIRDLASAGHSQREIARKFGVSQRTAARAILRMAWKHID